MMLEIAPVQPVRWRAEMFSSISRPKLCRLLGFALFFNFGLACIGQAQSAKVPEKQCGDYDTQSEMNECAAREAHKADVALNATYKALIQELKGDKTAITKLVAAEKAWIAFRDAELAADWPVADGENPNLRYGSVHPFCYYNELSAMTQEREKTLRNRLHHEEGDVCTTAVASRRERDEAPRSCGTARISHS
jgi:uncharacterized protein YecT (DUF1311 family)